MSIPVEQEDIERLKEWGMGLERLQERCVLCGTPTRTWHDATNQPVCGECAESKNVSDLPRKPGKISA